MDEQVNGWVNRWVDEWVHGWINGWNVDDSRVAEIHTEQETTSKSSLDQEEGRTVERACTRDRDEGFHSGFVIAGHVNSSESLNCSSLLPSLVNW